MCILMLTQNHCDLQQPYFKRPGTSWAEILTCEVPPLPSSPEAPYPIILAKLFIISLCILKGVKQVHVINAFYSYFCKIVCSSHFLEGCFPNSTIQGSNQLVSHLVTRRQWIGLQNGRHIDKGNKSLISQK